ncbi:MAG: Bcr/CflA family efflux MFS transporter [Gemmobacter sp.]|uniref:Bcr/CflA family efflux MFS transporter n=1 Tax=Gemmobacter sp. TaxID=1898957 RepID=UPI00391C59E9
MSRNVTPPRFLDRSSPPHLATLILFTGISAMSMNVFLPSLPAMAEWFRAPYATVQLSVSLYLALSGALNLVIGPLADRFGRRPVALWACGGFLLATVGVLLAPTVEVFLVCRMMQAVIAGGMVLSRAAVRDMVPEAQAASMIGYLTMGMSLVPMFGPAMGGWLDEQFGWQANFLVLLALGAAVMALIWADMGETAERHHSSFGAQLRQYPALLTSRRFWGYSVAAAASSGAFFSFLGGAPAVGTRVHGLTPSELGLYFSIAGVGYLLGNFVSARISVRRGVVRMVRDGCIVIVAALGLMVGLTLAGISHPAVFFGLMGVVGLGNGMALPSANAGMMSVRPDLAGSASGLGGALMIGGGAALSALAAAAMGAGDDPLPLMLLMLACGVAGWVSIALVQMRNRRLGL